MRMADLARQLEALHVGVAGVQELRWAGSDQKQLPGTKWQMVWSGQKKHGQHGVGLLMSAEWEAAMHSWEPVSDRLPEVQFRANRSQAVACIVGYAPLVGAPSPPDLHTEDTAVFHSILSSLGSRRTAERLWLTI